MEYIRPYKNLSDEGRKDILFFKDQLKHFQSKLAAYAFSDIQKCETIQETTVLLKILVKVCEIHQKHLERMEQSEYKAYLIELGVNCGNSQEPKEQAGTINRQPSIFKRKITWTT